MNFNFTLGTLGIGYSIQIYVNTSLVFSKMLTLINIELFTEVRIEDIITKWKVSIRSQKRRKDDGFYNTSCQLKILGCSKGFIISLFFPKSLQNVQK